MKEFNLVETNKLIDQFISSFTDSNSTETHGKAKKLEIFQKINNTEIANEIGKFICNPPPGFSNEKVFPNNLDEPKCFKHY